MKIFILKRQKKIIYWLFLIVSMGSNSFADNSVFYNLQSLIGSNVTYVKDKKSHGWDHEMLYGLNMDMMMFFHATNHKGNNNISFVKKERGIYIAPGLLLLGPNVIFNINGVKSTRYVELSPHLQLGYKKGNWLPYIAVQWPLDFKKVQYPDKKHNIKLYFNSFPNFSVGSYYYYSDHINLGCHVSVENLGFTADKDFKYIESEDSLRVYFTFGYTW